MNYAIVAQGSLTLKNGKFECKEGGIQATTGVVNLENVEITAVKRCIDCRGNVEVNTDKDCKFTTTGSDVTAFVKCNAAENVAILNASGKYINKCESGNYAISGNGTDPGSPIININQDAYIYSQGDSAIYQPSNAVMTVNAGSKIEGKDGIYLKSGKIIVKGGEIIGNGDADYSYNGNGSNAVGNGITVDFCSYPAGDPTLIVTGGSFSSDHRKSIDAYVPIETVKGSAGYTMADNNADLNNFVANNISIKGGTFNPEYDLIVPEEAEEA